MGGDGNGSDGNAGPAGFDQEFALKYETGRIAQPTGRSPGGDRIQTKPGLTVLDRTARGQGDPEISNPLCKRAKGGDGVTMTTSRGEHDSQWINAVQGEQGRNVRRIVLSVSVERDNRARPLCHRILHPPPERGGLAEIFGMPKDRHGQFAQRRHRQIG